MKIDPNILIGEALDGMLLLEEAKKMYENKSEIKKNPGLIAYIISREWLWDWEEYVGYKDLKEGK